MVNDCSVDQVQAADNSTADQWELRQSMRVILNTLEDNEILWAVINLV